MWAYIPSSSAPDTEGSASESSWQFQALAQSAWWRGKPSSSRNWFKRWKKDSWLKRLFSRMCEPSMASRGVDSWILSLAAIRASRSQSPASVLGPPIHAISGRIFSESLMRSNPPPVSSRMLTTTCAWDTNKSMPTWEAWVTSLRREYSVRLKQGRAMFGKGSTSLECEGTAWRSPQSANATQGPKSAALLAQVEETGQSEITLTDQAAHWGPWARPRASNTTGAGQGRNGPRDDIQSHAAQWTGLWGPPKAADATNPSGGDRGESNLWAQTIQHSRGSSRTTPCADDTGTRKKPYAQGGSPLSLQADSMMKAGGKSLISTPGSRPPSRLNPRFEEWLMRLPIGWIESGLSETELTLWSRRWRSRLFGTEYMESAK